jgi:ADP-dependent NAD(P)H-hydrate dehydratase / NAD(P)H-hydrate epimerase
LGAALLAGRAALKLGAGRTFVGCLSGAPVDMAQPELMLRPAADVVSLDGVSVLAVGPGLGSSEAARALVATAVGRDVPLLLDADALNVVAGDPKLTTAVAQRSNDTLLTPHPAEAARLLGLTTVEIQKDRVANALRLAERLRAVVVLKGAGSVCALPNGQWFINPTGNPGLASAGMGDVLAGIVAALVAQGCSPVTALLAGVHLHGLAGDRLREAFGGPVGITASEVIEAARDVLNETIYPPG